MNTPRSRPNTLLSASHEKGTDGPRGGSYKDIELAALAGGGKRDPWDDAKTEAGDEREECNGDGHKDKPSVHGARKKYRSAVGEELAPKCRTKRRRYPLPRRNKAVGDQKPAYC